MDEDVDTGFAVTRWLAWAAAGLLVIGAISVGTVKDGNQSAEQGLVAAAGSGVGGVDAPTTTTSSEPPTTIATATSLAVTSTTKLVPTTSAPVRTSTTIAQSPGTPPTTRPPATTTTAAPAARTATITVANDYTHAVILKLSGREFALEPGQQQGPFEYALEPNGNDTLEISLVALPACGLGDAGGIFPGPGRYRLAVVASPGACTNTQGQPFPGPAFTVKPA
ncbi:MAG TPA: hypothetical protein VGV86_13345 [Acidimicrobiales bacterium]|nr:hypothetical protein [Acidimicrobiales bacterium]